MALKLTRLLRASARFVLTGTALLFSAPAFASTHYIDHHTAHTLRTAYHHGAAQHELAQHAVLHHVSYHVRHHTALQATSATYYDDGAGYHTALPHHHYYRRTRYAHFLHSGLQCVPYAREISHIELSGDAFLWWAEASGRYARGNVPAEGAVLNFRAIGRMPLGHVAVVTAVEDSRTILVTQANWVRGSITNDVTVQDVSPNNDWSQVEVELGDSSTWGASYPIYGFIYNHPDTGTVIAANGQGNEVAEAPAVTQVSDEAPDRNLQ